MEERKYEIMKVNHNISILQKREVMQLIQHQSFWNSLPIENIYNYNS